DQGALSYPASPSDAGDRGSGFRNPYAFLLWVPNGAEGQNMPLVLEEHRGKDGRETGPPTLEFFFQLSFKKENGKTRGGEGGTAVTDSAAVARVAGDQIKKALADWSARIEDYFKHGDFPTPSRPMPPKGQDYPPPAQAELNGSLPGFQESLQATL